MKTNVAAETMKATTEINQDIARASVTKFTCPAGEYRTGAFGLRWTAGFSVRLADGSLLANRDGSPMCFRTKRAALAVAADIAAQ